MTNLELLMHLISHDTLLSGYSGSVYIALHKDLNCKVSSTSLSLMLSAFYEAIVNENKVEEREDYFETTPTAYNVALNNLIIKEDIKLMGRNTFYANSAICDTPIYMLYRAYFISLFEGTEQFLHVIEDIGNHVVYMIRYGLLILHANINNYIDYYYEGRSSESVSVLIGKYLNIKGFRV